MLSGSFKATSWQSARNFLPNDRIIAKPSTCHLIASRWSASILLLTTLVFVCQPLKAYFQLSDTLQTESALLLRMESTKFWGLCNLALNLFQNVWNVLFLCSALVSYFDCTQAFEHNEMCYGCHTGSLTQSAKLTVAFCFNLKAFLSLILVTTRQGSGKQKMCMCCFKAWNFLLMSISLDFRWSKAYLPVSPVCVLKKNENTRTIWHCTT